DFHDARRHWREVPGHRPAGAEVLYQADPAVLGLSEGHPRTSLYRLGHADLQHQRLERAVLPDHRRPLQDLRWVDDADALVKLQSGERPALRALHDALRLQTLGGAELYHHLGRQLKDVNLGA